MAIVYDRKLTVSFFSYSMKRTKNICISNQLIDVKSFIQRNQFICLHFKIASRYCKRSESVL